MSLNPSNFLLSLAAQMATAASCTLGTDLFVHQLPAAVPISEGGAAVLTIYGGPAPDELRYVPGVSVQCMVHATDASAGLALAQRLYESLRDSSDSCPRRHWSIDGKAIVAGQVDDDPDVAAWDVRLVVLMQPPGIVGRDESGRWNISFNFDVRFSMPSTPPPD